MFKPLGNYVLIVFGVSLLISIGIPTWVSGLLAVAAGVLVLIDR